MDKNTKKLLQKWLENNLISQESFNKIFEFENNSIPTQKSKIARAITLIGSLFVLSGLLGTLPLIWMNLAYWAQLLLLIIILDFYSTLLAIVKNSKKNFVLFLNHLRESHQFYF